MTVGLSLREVRHLDQDPVAPLTGHSDPDQPTCPSSRCLKTHRDATSLEMCASGFPPMLQRPSVTSHLAPSSSQCPLTDFSCPIRTHWYPRSCWDSVHTHIKPSTVWLLLVPYSLSSDTLYLSLMGPSVPALLHPGCHPALACPGS